MKSRLIVYLSVLSLIASSGACQTAPVKKAAVSSATVHSAVYTGRLFAERAEFVADYEIDVPAGKGELGIELVSGAIGLTDFETSSTAAAIRRDDRSLCAFFREKGRYEVRLSFNVLVESSQDIWKTLKFTAGPALVRKLHVSTAGEDSQIELLTGTTAEMLHQDGNTRTAGVLGFDNDVSVRWQSRVKEKTVKPVILCNVHQVAELSPTAMKIKARLAYEIPQGAAESLEALIPTNLVVVAVSGDHIRDWNITRQEQAQLCRVDLLKPATGSYRLDISAESSLENLAAAVPVPEIRAAGVDRQGGTVTLVPDDVVLTVSDSGGLNRMNSATAAELAGWGKEQTARFFSSYQYSKTGYSLRVAASPINPEIAATSRIRVHIGESRCQVTDQLQLDVKKAGVFAVDLSVPAGLTVGEVTGKAVESWNVAGATNESRLTIRFNRKVLGSETVTIAAEKTYSSFPAAIELVAPKVARAESHGGTIGVSRDAGIEVQEGNSTGLRPIPVSGLSSAKGDEALAYSVGKRDWKLCARTGMLQPRISAEVFNLVTLGDGMLTGSATINYLVENAGIQELTLAVPDAWQNVDFTGADIRRRAVRDGKTVVVLQDKILGRYTLVVTYDQSFDSQKDPVAIAGLRTDGTARERGYAAIVAGSGLQISEAKRTGQLRPMDPKDLPAQYRALIDGNILQAYSYPYQPYGLTLKTVRHEQQELPALVADHVKLISVISKTGRRETQATYLLKNNKSDSLRIKLPAGAKLWSTFLDGKAVKPELDKDTVVMPLKRTDQPGRVLSAELTYVEQGKPMGVFLGTPLSLVGPRSDVHASYAQWEVYLPDWVTAGRFDGTVRLERGFNRTVGSELDLVAGTLHKISQTCMGLFIVGVIIVLFITLIVVGIRSGYGRHIGTVLGIGAMVALFVAISVPSFVKARNTSQQNACINNLRQIDSGKEQAALAYKWGDTDMADVGTVNMYIKGNMTPACPSGGTYTYGRMDQNPRCTHPGHHLATSGMEPVVDDAPVVSMSERRNTENLRQIESAALGLLPVRIGLPKEGHAWLFSKVLNTDNEPLGISATLFSLQLVHVILLVLAAALLFAGLYAGWKGHVNSSDLGIALCIVLLFFSAGVFAYAERVLYHFMLAVPLVLAAVAVAAVLRGGPRATDDQPGSGPDSAGDVAGGGATGAASPGVVVLALAVGMLVSWSSMKAQAEEPAREPLKINFTKSVFKGIVTEGVARFEGEIMADVVAPLDRDGEPSRMYRPADRVLLGKEAALESFATKGKGAKLMTKGDGTVLHAEHPGSYRVKLGFITKVKGDAAGRALTFDLPAGICTLVDCSLDEREATVTAPTAVSVERTFGGGRTDVKLVIGPLQRLDLRWIPRVKRAREAAVAAFCRSVTTIRSGEGAVVLYGGLAYQVTQGEMLMARVQVPKELRLLRVAGDKVRSWESRSNAAGTELLVEMKAPLDQSDVLTLESEMTLPELPATVNVNLPAPLDVQRACGYLGVESEDEIESIVKTQAGVQQIDPAEFVTQLMKGMPAGGEVQQAFQFWKPDSQVLLDIRRVRPETKVSVSEVFELSEKDVFLSADLRYQVKKAGVYELAVGIPDGFEVDSVRGANIRQWKTDDAKAGRELRVAFGEKVRGEAALAVALRQPREFAAETAVPAIVPLDVQECTGFVSVGSRFGITITDHKAEGLTAIPVNELPAKQDGAVLGFKFRGPGWKMKVSAELSPAWVQADAGHIVHLTEDWMSIQSDITYAIQNAPVDRFDIVFPAGAENIHITGDGIRQETQKDGTRTIILQNKVSGAYRLAASYDLAMAPGTMKVNIPLARTSGPERETGTILVTSVPSLHVSDMEQGKQAMMKADIQDVPAEMLKKGKGVARRAYRYLRRDQELLLGLKQYEMMETLQANVESVKLSSVLADDGQMMTMATYFVRNNSKQHVRITLPVGSKLWACFVAGEPVRTTVEAGAVLVPLVTTADDEPPFRIQIHFVGKMAPLKGGREIVLNAPALADVPIQSTTWEMYLPKGYTYSGFKGTAARKNEAATFHEFGFSEYFDVLISESVAKKKRAQELVQKAEKSVLLGDIAGGRRKYRQAVESDPGNSDARRGLGNLSQVETYANAVVNPLAGSDAEFNRAVKRAWEQQSGGTQAEEVLVAPEKSLQNAGVQVDKIHRLQNESAGKADQLRLNLPVEGHRYVFEQILCDDKPVTVSVKASRETKFGVLRVLIVLAALLGCAVLVVNGWARRQRMRTILGTVLLAMLYVYVVFV